MSIFKLSGGYAKKLRLCLTGQLKCLQCGKPSTCAIESWNGYKPCCDECAKIGESNGYIIIRKIENEKITRTV